MIDSGCVQHACSGDGQNTATRSYSGGLTVTHEDLTIHGGQISDRAADAGRKAARFVEVVQAVDTIVEQNRGFVGFDRSSSQAFISIYLPGA